MQHQHHNGDRNGESSCPLKTGYTFTLFSAHGKLLERYKRQLSNEELLSLSPEELCKDRISEEYFRLTTEGDCRDVVRYETLFFTGHSGLYCHFDAHILLNSS